MFYMIELHFKFSVYIQQSLWVGGGGEVPLHEYVKKFNDMCQKAFDNTM